MLILALLQSCSSHKDAAFWNLVLSPITSRITSGDSVLPPIYAYKRDIQDNDFGEDEYNQMEQEMIIFNENKKRL